MENISTTKNNNIVLEKKDIKEIIPIRQTNSHKYNYGRVLIIAGSRDMPGAATLAANASLKMGAGVVELATPCLHPAIYPEVIPIKLIDFAVFRIKDFKILNHKTYIQDAVVIGPGMTKNTIQLTRELVLNNPHKSWIIDADGIAAFDVNDKLNKNVILTPHLEEFSRLHKNIDIDIDIKKLNKQKLFDLVKETATKMDCNILLKGPTTFITDGNISYYNNFGNPGMATAGTGDVLAGIIAANIAKKNKGIIKTDFLKTAALSSLIHSLSADYYVKNNDMETLAATDIIDNLKNVIKKNGRSNVRKWFRFISILQLFIATGICIFYSDQENIHLPTISGIDKILHFGAYFIYGLSLQVFFIALFSMNKISRKKYYLLTIICGFLFAISDEIHQYFVPGRHADILDLLIDWAGISLSLLCFGIIKKVYYFVFHK